MNQLMFLKAGMVVLPLVAGMLLDHNAANATMPLLPDPSTAIQISPLAASPPPLPAQPQPEIAALADGSYQFCSQPKPMNWQNGAGVCFVFNKVNDRVEGYYGYPHSDNFMCIRGDINHHLIIGEAFVILWGGYEWNRLPDTPFTWDDEGHLTLSQGDRWQSVNHSHESINGVLFRHAVLDTAEFYQYPTLQMVAPAQLCNWQELPQS